ncbi:MAG TPA: phosphotransferase, partial [Mycobacteriales bacterium]|nr:phosphotransferase [Mycobacteriales bacterium]
MDTRILAEQWGITGVAHGQRLQSYPTRTVHRITSDQGAFAVKVDEAPGPDPGAVQSAAARELPGSVAGIRRTLGGSLSALHGECRITVYEDVCGGHPPATPETWSALGTLLARLHAIPVSVRPFAVPIGAAASELERLSGDYSFAAEFRSLARRVREIQPSPAAAIVHGEVNLTNVLRRPTGELVLIDWDNAGAGPIALDLGYPLICVFLSESLEWNLPCAAAFYEAYRAARTGPPP